MTLVRATRESASTSPVVAGDLGALKKQFTQQFRVRWRLPVGTLLASLFLFHPCTSHYYKNLFYRWSHF